MGSSTLATSLVDLVYHRSERGRLTASGRPSDQYQPPRFFGHIVYGLRQPEVGEALDLVGNGTERRA